jgi:hypothetical protein
MTDYCVEYGVLNLFKSSELSNSTDSDDFTYILFEGELKRIRISQKWFWSDGWQERHNEAVADLENGRYTTYNNGEDFIKAMHKVIADNEARNGG